MKGKRSDGYHLLETLFYPVNLADTLALEKSDQSGIRIAMSGLAIEVDPEKHLCKRAYDALSAKVGGLPGVQLVLVKRIPAGAGLGGGSSNAAFTLVGLNELFSLGFSLDQLAEISAPLGADVPFFIYNRPMLATGIGQDLEAFPLDLTHEIRLVTPPIHSSTVEAYQGLDLSQCDPNRSLKELLRLPVSEWKGKVVNDLEGPVFKQYPVLAGLKQQLYDDGALYAAMSGSGSALFGLFER